MRKLSGQSLRITARILAVPIAIALILVTHSLAQDEPTQDDAAAATQKKAAAPAPKRPPVSIYVGAKGVGRYRPGHWGIASVETINRTDEPFEYRSVLWFSSQRDLQFGRKIWVPAMSRRRTWVPVLAPVSKSTPRSLTINYAAFSASDEGEKYIEGATFHRSDDQPLMIPQNPNCFLLVSDQGSTDHSVSNTMKYYIGTSFKRQVSLLSLVDTDFPMIPEALDIIDCIILSGDQIMESAAAVSATRAWVRRGGRLWLMLDRVSPETVEALVGGQLQITELDRTSLTDYTLETDVGARGKSTSKLSLETPVELVRVLANGGAVTHRVGEWPAAIRVPVGQGYVLCSMLALEGWLPRSDTVDRTERPRDVPYFVTPAATDLANLILRSQPSTPVTDDVWKQYLAARIGYSVPDRSVVLYALIGYCLALLVAAVVFRRSGNNERLIWFIPGVTVLTAAILVTIGSSANRLESMVHIGQLVQAEKGINELEVSGVIGVYSDRKSTHTTGTTRGGMFLPDQASLTGTSRMDWSDIGKWEMKDLEYSAASVRFASYTTMLPAKSPIAVRGTFDSAGFTAAVSLGPMETLEDPIVVTQSHITLPLDASDDGASVVGHTGNELPPGEYLSASLLSDEQQRRQAILREVLASKRRLMSYPNGPTMMAWTKPLDLGFVLPHKPQGSALVTVPIEITRPDPGTNVSIPAPFVTYKSVQGKKGAGFSSTFRNSSGTWSSSSSPGTSTLRFQIPIELLPVKVNSATLKVTMTAPSRTATFLSGSIDDQREARATNSPVGEVHVPISSAPGLLLDEHGGLHVSIKISDVLLSESQKGEFGTQDQDWRIDFVQLEVQATIE
jgi:hypothetical protein